MKKRIILLILSILFLTGCMESNKQSTKESIKESEIKLVKIESNKPKIKEEKKINVFKIYERGHNFSVESKEVIDQTYSIFNDTEQKVYKDSLTLLIAKSFYDDVENRIYVVGILYNNTGDKIKNFEFKGILNFKLNDKEFSSENVFGFDSVFFPYVEPYEGVNVGIGFDAQGFGELLDSNIEYNSEDIQVDLEDIEFTIMK
ncbi:hypothetical protein [Isobaculum melis]|uniref:DUF4352 domain-containing protein n=1 Tax=Isobaculum melis TaxID=142588 RepID=A0A1H9UIU8_9LACT|nr:hypothetical protein [Isobaculum melis]SES09440.1 hypothetical protein SAMN04488559_1337 [Isobaculum melis]